MTKIFALGLLGLMFILMFFSAWNDSATMDELAHIPSGYSYLTQKDYRLNPEHPPLIKDLSAAPLLFLNLNFPANIPAWTEYVNGQWDMGRFFLYESGNDADKILLFSRLPIMLLALLLGWLLFRWISGIYGSKVGLLTLFFYAMSPTIIAHSRYVTTDLGAAFGFFIGLSTFINFLKNQTRKNIMIAGVAFGIAQLLKFSLVILAPIYVLLGILWVILDKWSLRSVFKIIAKIILIGIIGAVVIWLVYLFHVWNYPPEKQYNDTQFTLTSFNARPLANFVIWLSDKPILRAIGQYLLGVLMVMQRASGGNTAYFMGTVSASGSTSYFPILYLLKEQLIFHIFTLIAILFSIQSIIKAKEKNLRVIAKWMRDNFAVVAGIIFIAVYVLQSVTSNLNIGVRHILPILPFIYLLVALAITKFNKPIITGFLLVIMFISIIIAYPYYLSYYNVLAGGTANGYKIATDSNYDWGQDMKRLRNWAEKNNVPKIAIDYFGGGNTKYYFGDPENYGASRYEDWWSSKGQPSTGSWFAISANSYMNATAKTAPGFERKKEDSYPWLEGKEPVARAGSSIFIYKF